MTFLYLLFGKSKVLESEKIWTIWLNNGIFHFQGKLLVVCFIVQSKHDGHTTISQ